MTSAIVFDHVSKKYRRRQALDAVSFEVPTGSVFVLIGDNGAGKTTSIKSMLGLVRPDGGSIQILGLDASREDQRIRERVGYVPEQPDLYDWMRVDEIGWFVAGVRQGDFYRNFKAHMEKSDVPLTSRIAELSKGMKAKVALALAISHEPEVLILDEPTSGLDPLVRREFMESMVDRAAAGGTVFLSSHQLSEVERVADYVAVLKAGKLLFVERLSDLKEKTAELTITLTKESEPLSISATTIHCQVQGRQQRLLIRDFESRDALIEQLNQQAEVQACQWSQPSLEEIFVGYVSIGETASSPGQRD